MQQETADYDVIIIGAGWSGLLASKYCIDEGLKTLVLECRNGMPGRRTEFSIH